MDIALAAVAELARTGDATKPHRELDTIQHICRRGPREEREKKKKRIGQQEKRKKESSEKKGTST